VGINRNLSGWTEIGIISNVRRKQKEWDSCCVGSSGMPQVERTYKGAFQPPADHPKHARKGSKEKSMADVRADATGILSKKQVSPIENKHCVYDPDEFVAALLICATRFDGDLEFSEQYRLNQ